MRTEARQPKPIPHEITIVAFSRDEETGNVSILDICETSRRFAPSFARRFYRNREAVAISAHPPGHPIAYRQMRTISREAR